MTELKENATEQETNEYIDNLEEADVDVLLSGEEIKETPEIKDEKIEKPETDESEKVDTEKDKPEVKDDQEKPAETDSKEEKPEEAVTIDDEYIKNADEKDKKILESIKGESVSPKLLKKHLASAHATELYKGEKGEVISKLDSLKKDFEKSKQEINQVKNTPEKQTQIDEIVLKRLKAKYSDFPETEEEMNELGYESSTKAFKYMNAQKEEKAFVQEHINKVEYYQKNSAEINTEVINNDISLIKSELEKYGVTEEDLGISFEFNEKGDFKDERLDKLFLNDKMNAFDSNLIDSTYGIPIMKENAFARKFQNEFLSDVFKAVKNNALVEGAKEKKETESITQTMSQSVPGSQVQFEEADRKIANMSEKDVDADIERLR